MAIKFYEQEKVFKLSTSKTDYIFRVSEAGVLEHIYYGVSLPEYDLDYTALRGRTSFHLMEEDLYPTFNYNRIRWEYPVGNSGDLGESALMIENADGTKGCRLIYQSHTVKRGREKIEGMPYSRNYTGTETLTVNLVDKEKGIEIKAYYTVYSAWDVITRYVKITNRAVGDAYVEKAASMSLDFIRNDYDFIDLKGSYAFERAIESRVPLTSGSYSVNSRSGMSSHYVNPFFAIAERTATEHHGDCFGFNLVYSGNFTNVAEIDKDGKLRVISGINSEGMRWKLSKGQSFYTPEAIMTYSDQGLGGMSRNFHDHIRRTIIEEKFVTAKRPIVVNTWEGSRFSVTEQGVLNLAKEALKVGADTVVLDDGWFRDGEGTGLGDWKVAEQKFPSGIPALCDKIHEMGLKFGIWIEPEMAGENSDFAKNYSDRLLRTHDCMVTGRRQYVIDFSDTANVDYIFYTIVEALKGAKVDYIKWDANRYLTEVGSKVTPSGEVYHRHVLGVYRLCRLIKEQYPDVLIEMCAGGGGRFDLGMLSFSPQIWASDNTDPFLRVHINYGTSLAYPTSTISVHYTASKFVGIETSPEFRYLVGSFGPYGYELDITKLDEETKNTLKGFTDRYNQISNFTLDCDLYRLISPATGHFCAYVQVKKDKSQALLTFIQTVLDNLHGQLFLRLKGLDENTIYENSETGQRLSGKTLMTIGVRIERLHYSKSGSGKQIIFRAVK